MASFTKLNYSTKKWCKPSIKMSWWTCQMRIYSAWLVGKWLPNGEDCVQSESECPHRAGTGWPSTMGLTTRSTTLNIQVSMLIYISPEVGCQKSQVAIIEEPTASFCKPRGRAWGLVFWLPCHHLSGRHSRIISSLSGSGLIPAVGCQQGPPWVVPGIAALTMAVTALGVLVRWVLLAWVSLPLPNGRVKWLWELPLLQRRPVAPLLTGAPPHSLPNG